MLKLSIYVLLFEASFCRLMTLTLS